MSISTASVGSGRTYSEAAVTRCSDGEQRSIKCKKRPQEARPEAVQWQWSLVKSLLLFCVAKVLNALAGWGGIWIRCPVLFKLLSRRWPDLLVLEVHFFRLAT